MSKAIFDKLAAAEKSYFTGETLFVSPIVRRQTQVATRIAGIECKFDVRVTHRRTPGWYVLRATNHEYARIVRPATEDQIVAYGKLFRRRQVLCVRRSDDGVFGIPIPFAKNNPDIVRVAFAEGVDLFDYMETVFDGRTYFYRGPYSRRDLALLEQLRENFRLEHKNVAMPGLLPEEKKAYAVAYALFEEANKSKVERRLEKALAHGNAKLLSYRETGAAIVVDWEYDGVRQTSTVRAEDLTVTTAGICLNAQDQNFDLASLPSVFREKTERAGREYDDEYDD